jgi:NAD(P)H-hydrate repair Nnr-like enzyme with NAD(P)H-hydrate epimerase domain
MSVDEMNFTEHLRQFFSDEVADDELKQLAVHAIANDVRKLKPAISQAVWEARQQSALGTGVNNGADGLSDARQLHGMYLAALDEFTQITQTQLPAEAVAGHDESTRRTEDDSDSTREHS